MDVEQMQPRRQPRHKREPSFHQKEMRFWLVTSVAVAVIVFGALLYLVNRWLSPVAL